MIESETMKGLTSSFLNDKTGRQSHSPCHVFALLSDLHFSLLYCTGLYLYIQMRVSVSVLCCISQLILYMHVALRYRIQSDMCISLYSFDARFVLSSHYCCFVSHVLYHISYILNVPVNYPLHLSSLISLVSFLINFTISSHHFPHIPIVIVLKMNSFQISRLFSSPLQSIISSAKRNALSCLSQLPILLGFLYLSSRNLFSV